MTFNAYIFICFLNIVLFYFPNKTNNNKILSSVFDAVGKYYLKVILLITPVEYLSPMFLSKLQYLQLHMKNHAF